MTARALPEDGKPCVAPVERPRFHRVFGALCFPGAVDVPGAGPVDTSAMPESHPGGVTPTTKQATPALACLVDGTLRDLDGALAEARRLFALGRHDEAKFELSQVVALGREAIGWLK